MARTGAGGTEYTDSAAFRRGNNKYSFCSVGAYYSKNLNLSRVLFFETHPPGWVKARLSERDRSYLFLQARAIMLLILPPAVRSERMQHGYY